MTWGRRVALGLYRLLLRLAPRKWQRRWRSEAEELFLQRLETRGWLWSALPALVDAVRHVAPLPGGFRRLHVAAHVGYDIRYSVRRIWKDRLFSATAVLAIGVALAGTNALFTFVDAALFAPFHVTSPSTLVHLYTTLSESNPYGSSSWADLRRMRESVDGLQGVAGFQRMIGKVALDGAAPATVAFSDGTWNLLTVAGVRPFLGSAAPPAGGRGVVLEHGYWQRHFAGRRDVLGHTLTVLGGPVPIIGVAPEAFTGFTPGVVTSFWYLSDSRGREIVDSNSRTVVTFGRLAPGASMAALQGQLDRLATALSKEAPETHRGRRFTALPFEQVRFNPQADRVLKPLAAFVFLGAALLLALVCSNLATFVLARAEDRRTEIATRLALGSGRSGILRQAGIEALVLSLVGTGVGVALGTTLVRQAMARLSLPIPVNVRIELGGRTIVFSLIMSAIAALMFGVAPYASMLFGKARRRLALELRGTGASRRTNRMLTGALAGQVAIAILLTVTAGVLLRSLQARGATDPGFRSQGLGVALVTLDEDRDDDPEEAFGELVRDLRRRGAADVGQSSWLPLQLEHSSMVVNVPGVAPPAQGDGYQVTMAVADAGYFRALGIMPVRGGTFSGARPDDQVLEVMVNEAFEARFGRGGDMVGSTLELPRSAGGVRQARVVGVVPDHQVTTAGEGPTPLVYRSLSQFPTTRRYVEVDLGPTFSMDAFRRTLQGHPELEVHRVMTMEEHLSDALGPARALMTFFLVLGVLGLFLVIVGATGAARYACRRRGLEMAIRSTLGARSRHLLADLLRDSLRPLASGAILGTLLSAATVLAVRGLLFGVHLTDPRVALLPLVIPTLAAMAAALPTLALARRDPAERLRES